MLKKPKRLQPLSPFSNGIKANKSPRLKLSQVPTLIKPQTNRLAFRSLTLAPPMTLQSDLTFRQVSNKILILQWSLKSTYSVKFLSQKSNRKKHRKTKSPRNPPKIRKHHTLTPRCLNPQSSRCVRQTLAISFSTALISRLFNSSYYS